MSRIKLPPELRNLKIAQHPIFIMGLTISVLSLAANIGYWTKGNEGAFYWINFTFAGLVEVVFVFLIWLGANIWKSGGRALAVGLIALSLGPWLASSISNYMFLTTLNDPALASTQSTLFDARQRKLTADLSRYERLLTQYDGVERKDVEALETRQAYCDRVAKDECSSVDLADEIAVNKAMTDLEESQEVALKALEGVLSERNAAITNAQFSVDLLIKKLDGHLLSREFLLVIFLDILKAVLFLVGIWISLRLHRASKEALQMSTATQTEIEAGRAKIRGLEDQIAALKLQASKKRKPTGKQKTSTKSGAATEQLTGQGTPGVPVNSTGAGAASHEPDAGAIVHQAPVSARPAPLSGEIQYTETQADGTTLVKTKKIA